MDCLKKFEVYHQKAYVSVITKTILAFFRIESFSDNEVTYGRFNKDVNKVQEIF